jgi:hypothetical protein
MFSMDKVHLSHLRLQFMLPGSKWYTFIISVAFAITVNKSRKLKAGSVYARDIYISLTVTKLIQEWLTVEEQGELF